MVEPASPIRFALVADDDALIRRVVAMTLESDGWTVLECADGGSVIDALDGSDIDLCIMDRRMPGASLETRLEALARRRPRAAVVILSGGDDARDGYVHLAKPVELTDLRDGIARALDARRLPLGSAER